MDSPTLATAIESFHGYLLKVRRLAPQTCISYPRHLRTFARWHGPQAPVSSLTYLKLEDYIITTKAGVSSASLANLVGVLHSFGKYLLLQGLVPRTSPLFSPPPKLNASSPSICPCPKSRLLSPLCPSPPWACATGR